MQFDLRLPAHGKEEPAVSRQSLPVCRRVQTYIRRGLMCYVNYKMLSRAPELRIGLVNDIVCELIYVIVMPT